MLQVSVPKYTVVLIIGIMMVLSQCIYYGYCDYQLFNTLSEISPERIVNIAENASDFHCSDNSSECPDELYNLTKLAEVAAAAGQILENRQSCISPVGAEDDRNSYTYIHKLFDKSSRAPRSRTIKVSKIVRSLKLSL